ncbi:MAG: orotidine-5'-phosphate decarboxylase [Patescibacteria group bacterium]|nr:orotidine-5'-phosphate decarboxylase [Patescibacteria group bacterium]
MKANEQILERMRVHNTLLCCGLDPDLKKMPPEITVGNTSDEEKVLAFLRGVIDVTAPHVCAFKAQKAFFDVLNGGHDVLKELIDYIHTSNQGVPVIVDCKIGDIENTMEAYIQNLFGLLQADGIVVNPYMGDDVMLPLVELTDKSIVVLVKTSNPSGGIVQDVVIQDGQPLWRHVLDLVINRWNRSENMILVLSSTAGLNMEEIRTIVPDNMPILLAGVGAQGGSYTDLRKLLNSEGTGAFINSSRGILYPQQSKQFWQSAVEKAAVELKEALNKEGGRAR